MMRNALVALAAIVVIGAGFVALLRMGAMDQARAFALGVPYTNFNWKTAHAQERGCNACHADHLAADTNRLIVGAREAPIARHLRRQLRHPDAGGGLPDLP